MFSLVLKALLLSLVLAGGASAAGPVTECDRAMVGEWICGETRYLKISYAVGEDGVTRVTFVDGWLSGKGAKRTRKSWTGRFTLWRTAFGTPLLATTESGPGTFIGAPPGMIPPAGS